MNIDEMNPLDRKRYEEAEKVFLTEAKGNLGFPDELEDWQVSEPDGNTWRVHGVKDEIEGIFAIVFRADSADIMSVDFSPGGFHLCGDVEQDEQEENRESK